MKILLSIIATFFSVNALATGSTTCLVDDENVKLEAHLTNGRVTGNPIVAHSTVDVQLKPGKSPVVGLSAYTFDVAKKEIPSWYNVGGELRLLAYAEPTEVDGTPIDAWVAMSVDIKADIVETGDMPYYVGVYTVTSQSNSAGPGFLSESVQGFIKCTIE